MNISDVKIHRLREPKGAVKAYANITLDDAICIKGFKIVEGSDGNIFLGMPDKRKSESRIQQERESGAGPSRNFEDIVYPINSEARRELEDVIFEEWERGQEQEQIRETKQYDNNKIVRRELDSTTPLYGRRAQK